MGERQQIGSTSYAKLEYGAGSGTRLFLTSSEALDTSRFDDFPGQGIPSKSAYTLMVN